MIVSQGKCPFPAPFLHNPEGWVSNWIAYGGIRIDHRWDTHVRYLRTWSFSNLTIKMIIKVHYPTTNVIEIISTQYFLLVALVEWSYPPGACTFTNQAMPIYTTSRCLTVSANPALAYQINCQDRRYMHGTIPRCQIMGLHHVLTNQTHSSSGPSNS